MYAHANLNLQRDMLSRSNEKFNGLAQDCSNSTDNALELLQSWAKLRNCVSAVSI